MLCRMLLGRTALGSDFVVDASRKYVASEKPRKKTKRKKKHRTFHPTRKED